MTTRQQLLIRLPMILTCVLLLLCIASDVAGIIDAATRAAVSSLAVGILAGATIQLWAVRRVLGPQAERVLEAARRVQHAQDEQG